ncbi:phosphatase domain-containing protein [Kineobactrum salinum]|uniref:Polynucleotide kinase PNKP phosphatase domain-containing protein n=1 Tax=Kineobactrum salinum TaxID=2708301 RepID=A0A6C0U4U0_9GAMM|nr:HAD family acid phosphatase [Kineobactrum salinum]QIB67121.1 hypothetical protein G3T16_18685 [Kineobactrum salinum]
MAKRMVIFDIDGTLADNEHRVHHLKGETKDWEAFFADQHLDTVRKDVARVFSLYASDLDMYIAVLTGRGEEYREVTERWLDKNGLLPNTLTMRPAGNRTNDDILKMEAIKSWQEEGYEIVGFYDDRKRICDAVRTHGITVFQMAAGDF